MILRFFLVCLSVCIYSYPSYAQPACVTSTCCCGSIANPGVPSGDFEDPPFASPILTFNAGETYGNWTVVAGSIDLLAADYLNWAAGNPNGASQYIDLNGSTAGTIATTLTGLIPGYTYTMVFWYAKNTGVSTAYCNVKIAGGAWLDETWGASNNGATGWLEICFSFTAQAATAELLLIGSSNVPYAGMLLDDINLWGCQPDDEAPVILNIPVSPVTLLCNDPVPPPVDLEVSDNCPSQPEILLQEATSGDGCFYTITRNWTITDECGNSATARQVLTFEDNEAPQFVVLPTNLTVACSSDFLSDFNNWVSANGGASATDNCDPNITWSAEYEELPDGSCGSTLVTFSITDACGHTNSAQVYFVVEDLEPPTVITLPEDLVLNCVESPLDSIYNWLITNGGATAVDLCEPVTWSHDFTGDISDPAILVNFTVTDLCENSVTVSSFILQSVSADTIRHSLLTCNPAEVRSDTVVVSVAPCETILITTISLTESDTTFLSDLVCNPNDARSDTLALINQQGCDSIVITDFLFSPADTTYLYMQTCDPLSAISDTAIYVGSRCDSIVITLTELLPVDSVLLTRNTCDPEASGTDTLFLTNQAGCDSIVITSTVFLPGDSIVLTTYSCDPADIGMDTLFLLNQNGCDSIVYINTHLTDRYVSTDTVMVCGAGTNYRDTLTVSGTPCDSLFITDYLHQQLDTVYIQLFTCDPEQSGTYTQTLTGSDGCDSTTISTIDLVLSDTTRIEIITCDETPISQDTVRLLNYLDCDSLVITSFVYMGLDTQFVTRYSCDPSMEGRDTILTPGPLCDTVTIVETLISGPSSSFETIWSCASGGVVQDTVFLTNNSGCDSMVIRAYQYTSWTGIPEILDETCENDKDGMIVSDLVKSGASPYEYSLDSIIWHNKNIDNLAPGSYTLYVRDIRGCIVTFKNLLINTGESPRIDIGSDRTAKAGEILTLNAMTTHPMSVLEWVAKDPLSCSECPETRLGPLAESQQIMVSGFSMLGCPAWASVYVTVVPGRSVFIPDAFSPNGDGINDIFTVYGDQIAVIKRLIIYDRWGNTVYESEKLNVADSAAGWDGSYKGRPMDPATFVYIVEVELTGGEALVLSGDIMLIR